MTRIRSRARVRQWHKVRTGKIGERLPYGFLRMSVTSGELARSRRHRQLPPLLRPRYHVFRRMSLKQMRHVEIVRMIQEHVYIGFYDVKRIIRA